MSAEHDDLDLDDQLRAFAVALELETGEPIRPGPGRRRADGRDATPLEPAVAAPGRRGWLLPAIASAAVMVVVVAGLVVLVDGTSPSDEPGPVNTGDGPPESAITPESTITPETSITPETTATAPAELSAPEPGETQQTIVGDITWTLVEGDASTQPSFVQAEIDGEFYGLEADGRAWRSTDGITWELTERRPEGILGVFDYGGETWARTTSGDGSGLSRWDGEAFVPVELPASSAPEVDGLQRMGGFPSQHVELGGDLVLPVTTRLVVPWSDLYGTELWPEWDAVTETIRLRDPESNDPLPVAVLTTELLAGDPGSIEFRDATTGDLVTTVELLPGVEPDELVRRLVTGTGLMHSELVIGDGTDFEVVPTPWPLAEAPRLAVLGSNLLAVVQRDPADPSGFESREWELWTSADARTWTLLQLPEPFGSLIDDVDIVSDGTRALLTIVSRGGDAQRPELWSTEDGTTWRPVEGAASWSGTEVTDFGWFQPLFDTGLGIRVSPDGLVWQEIPLDLDEPSGPGGGGSSVFGHTIFVSSFEDGGARTMWVGRVAEG